MQTEGEKPQGVAVALGVAPHQAAAELEFGACFSHAIISLPLSATLWGKITA